MTTLNSIQQLRRRVLKGTSSQFLLMAALLLSASASVSEARTEEGALVSVKETSQTNKRSFDAAGTLSDYEGFCNAPDLPNDLSIELAVEAGGKKTDHEVHLHGLYRIGLDDYNEVRGSKVHEMKVRFDDRDDKNAGDYALRIAIAPHDADTIDLYLFNGLCKSVTRDSRPIVFSNSVTTEDDAEQHIFSVIKANTDYCVQIAYTTTTQSGTPSDSSGDCATVLMEMAFQPEKALKRFVDACQYDDGSIPALPNPIVPHDENDNNYFFEHDSTVDNKKTFWAQYDANKLGQKTKVVARYPIDLPRVHGRNQRWKIWMSLQSRFLDSGDLTAILVAGDGDTIPNPSLCSPKVYAKGGSDSRNGGENNHENNGRLICWFGTRAIKNHVLIQSELWSPSKYTLWILLNRRGLGGAVCIPYSLDLKLFPLPEKENFVTCDIDPMPHSFNVPGMYNEAKGTMTFSQDILVNLTRDRECATIVPRHPNSLLRAFVGAHANLDLDISLEELESGTDKGKEKTYTTVASSSRVSGPDAVLYVLKRDVEYQVCVTISHSVRDYIPGQDHDFYDFCDSYDLRVDVFPLTAATGSVCENNRRNEPNFQGLQQVLDRDGEFRFGVADYSQFPYSAPIDLLSAPRQQTLFQFEFSVNAKSTFRAIAMPVDPVGTPVVLTLSRQRKAFDDSDVTLFMPIAYGEPLTIGQKLGWVLEQGTYRVEMATSPMQITEASSWSAWLKEMTSGAGRGTPLSTVVFPTCVNYNFELILTRKQQCLDALPLPNTIIPTTVAHRHIDERFLIDGASHSMIIVADDTLKRKDPALVAHFLVSRTDVPVTIAIYNNRDSDVLHPKPLLVSQPTSSGAAEMMATLKTDTEYRVEFTFHQASATSESLCRSLQLQLSLVGQREERQAAQCEATAAMSYSSEIVTLVSATEDSVIGPVSVPYDYAGKILKIEASLDERRQSHFVRRLTFSTPSDTTFRLTAEYEFPTHIVSARVCKCTPVLLDSQNARRSQTKRTVCQVSRGSDGSSACFSALGYFNGLQVPAMQIPKGDYVIELRWSARSGRTALGKNLDSLNEEDGFGSNNDWADDANGAADKGAESGNKDDSFCALIYLQFSLAPVVNPASAMDALTPTKSAANAASGMMCDPELQYLPKSLNAISYVWAGYSDEMHLFQNLLVPVQHESDVTKLRLTKTSLVRVSLPSDIVRAVVIVTNDATEFSSVENGFGVSGKMAGFAKLEPGSYTITIGYYKHVGAPAGGGGGSSTTSMTDGMKRMCQYVPFEMSVVPLASMDSLVEDADRCSASTSALPTTPKWDRDQIRYRDLARVSMKGAVSYSHTIPFTIDARGGVAMFDLRYSFPMGGLNVVLTGSLATRSSGTNNAVSYSPVRRLTWSRRTNRAYLDRELPAGRYNLTIFDPVETSSYAAASVASSCVAFSIHMRVISYSTEEEEQPKPLPPSRGGNSNNNNPTPTTTAEPNNALACSYTTYDTMPQRLDFKDTDEQRLELGGSAFPIPFGSTSSGANSVSNVIGKKSVTVDISIPARSGYTVRALGSTRASVSMEMQLMYDPTDTQQQSDEEDDEVMIDAEEFGGGEVSGGSEDWAFKKDASGKNIVIPNGPLNSNGAGAGGLASGTSAPSTGPIMVATSRQFGSSTSLTYQCVQGQCDNNGRFRLRIVFSFDRAPRYRQDYNDCMRKFALDSYRMFVSVQSSSVILQGTKCSDKQLAMLDTNSAEYKKDGPRLPPPEITLSTSAVVLSLPDAFVSDFDHIRNRNMAMRNDYNGGGGGRELSNTNNNNGGIWVPNGGVSGRGNTNNNNAPVGEGPSSFKLRTHASFNTTLVVAEGVENVTSYLQLRYNANFLNMKVEVFKMLPSSSSSSSSRNPSSADTISNEPIFEASGNPSTMADRSANAELHLLTSPLLSSDQTYLQPGRYLIRFSANLAFLSGGMRGGGMGGGGGGGHQRQQLEYCLPVSIYFMATANKYAPLPPRGNGNTNNNNGGGVTQVDSKDIPKKTVDNSVIDFSPRQLGSLDPSEPITITVSFSSPVFPILRGTTSSTSSSAAAMASLAYLQESDEGRDKSTLPHKVPVTDAKFVDEKTLMLTFMGPKWMTTYRLRFDGSMLKPRDASTDPRNEGYDASIINMPYASSYTSTWCSCDRAGYCVGGGGCGCTEINGETCNTCQPGGWELTTSPVLLFNGVRSRLCVKENAPLPPMRTHPSNLNNGDGGVREGGGGGGDSDNDEGRNTLSTGRPANRPPPTATTRNAGGSYGGGGNDYSGGRGGADGGGSNSGPTGGDSSSSSTPSSSSSVARSVFTFLGIGVLVVLSGLYAVNTMRQRVQRPTYTPLGSRPDALQMDDDDDEDDDEDDIIRPADMNRNSTTTTTANIIVGQTPSNAAATTTSTTAAIPIVNSTPVVAATSVQSIPKQPVVMGSIVSGGGVQRSALAVADDSSSAHPFAGGNNIVVNNNSSTGISIPMQVIQTKRAANVNANNGSGGKTRDPFADADDDDDFFGGANNSAI